MSLEVIAEGVENSNQIEILDLLGCEYIQGNYLAEPMPVAEFEAWLQDQPQANS
jgi:EAL domain-containing protein (putative c-di-GMP-specific phosphodiesterase class I)